MALVYCPDCHHPVSSLAENCMFCGYPLAKELHNGQKVYAILPQCTHICTPDDFECTHVLDELEWEGLLHFGYDDLNDARFCRTKHYKEPLDGYSSIYLPKYFYYEGEDDREIADYTKCRFNTYSLEEVIIGIAVHKPTIGHSVYGNFDLHLFDKCDGLKRIYVPDRMKFVPGKQKVEILIYNPNDLNLPDYICQK